MIKPIRKRRRLLALSIAATAITVTAFTIPAAQAADPNTAEGAGYTVEPVGDPFEAAYTIEPGTHPGADKIAAQKKILLKDGDGQIIYTECTGATGQFLIAGSAMPDVCFQSLGPTGWLKMEVPNSFGVTTRGKELVVTSIDAGKEKKTEIPLDANGNGSESIMNPDSYDDVIVVEISIKGTKK